MTRQISFTESNLPKSLQAIRFYLSEERSWKIISYSCSVVLLYASPLLDVIIPIEFSIRFRDYTFYESKWVVGICSGCS